MKLLLLGATGLVGSHALALALANDRITEVIAPTRQPLTPSPRLINPVVPHLESALPLLASNRPDAVICALGTTQAKAGSEAAFRHVDHELPVAFGRAAHREGVQTFVIVTAMGASAASRSFYYRTKGEVEADIQAIGFQSLTICRPSLIGGDRHEVRRAERIGLVVLRTLAWVLPKRLHVNPAAAIAAALVNAALAAEAGVHAVPSEAMH